MKARSSARWLVLIGALCCASAEAGPQGEAARQMIARGAYAEAARALNEERASPAGADFDDTLLLADANERAEGAYALSEAALAQADRLAGTDATAAQRHVRVALVRALLQAREGRFDQAPRTVLEARATAQAAAADPELQLAVKQTYGIVLLHMGLVREAFPVLLDVADARMKTLRDGDPVLLDSLYWLGCAQIGVKKYPEARDTLAEVVRVRTLAVGADHPETLGARLLLANALARIAPEAAVRERQEVLQEWTSRGDQHDARAVAALIAVGDDEKVNGNTAEALATYRAAYERSVESSPPIERLTAESALRLAKALLSQARYGDALATLADMAGRTPQIQQTPLAYDIQVTRAVLYVDLGQAQDAEPIYRNLIAIYDADPTLSRADRLTLVNNLAQVLATEGRFDAAIAPQREVVAARTLIKGPADPSTLAAKSSLATYLAHQSPPALAESVAQHRDVLAARRAQIPQDELAIASSLHNLAVSLDLAKSDEEAKSLISEAIAIRTRLLGPDHPDTINSKRELAGILFSTGDVDGARAAYEQIVASLERARIASTTTEDQRRTFFASTAQVYKWLAVMKAHAGDKSALAYADAARGRTLDEIATSGDALASIASPAESARLSDARAAFGRLTSADTTGMTGAQLDIRSAAIDAAGRRVAQIEASLQASHPQIRFATPFRPIDGAQLRAALGDATLLLDYSVLGDRIQLLWMAPDGSMGASSLLNQPALSETARAYVALLSASALAGTAADPMLDRAVFAWPDGSFRLRRLNEAIPDTATIVSDIAPVRGALSRILLEDVPATAKRAKRWIIVPDGPLAGVPFDTLSLDDHLVLETSAVSYVPSLQMLVDLQARRVAYSSLERSKILAIGAPSFSAAPAGSPLREWAELAGSRAEIDDLTRRYGLHEGQTLFSGADATEARLRQLDRAGTLADYKILYFSTHGTIDLASPERNAIILMGDGHDADSDGFVRAAELMSLHSRADLVVVSACESGVGTWLDGEGAMGLPYALFASGAASTLLTHWSVPDRSSSAFMARLLDKVDQGMDTALALQQTKLEFMSGRAGDAWTAPGFWAPFDLFGATRL